MNFVGFASLSGDMLCRSSLKWLPSPILYIRTAYISFTAIRVEFIPVTHVKTEKIKSRASFEDRCQNNFTVSDLSVSMSIFNQSVLFLGCVSYY